ncbi:hypothetical protein GCM10027425_19810 [Alteromonas gracilis]
MGLTELVTVLLILVGLLGVVIPVLPGSLLVLGGLLFYALTEQTTAAWVVLGLATFVVVVGEIAKYLLPGRSMKRAGVPTRSLVVGGVLGVVGFFVVPLLGLPLGFVLGVWVAERQRQSGDAAAAWASTWLALKAVGASILIEFGAALAAAVIWVVGIFVL